MIWMFLSFNILTCITFSLLNNPLSLGLMLILQTILFSILMGFMSSSFWFLYLLILIFIGGMLVLFIYVTSIFPNEKFSFDQKFFIMLFMLTMMILLTTLFYNYLFNLNLINPENMMNLKQNYDLINTNKIFSSQSNLILIFLVNYLFFCMMIVVKITNMNSGPLRKMN